MAIPHVDIKHVNSAAIAVGILEKPIEFHKMEEPEKSVNVGIIIMLALDKPHAHIDMLGKIIEMIKNKEVLKDIINEKNEETVLTANRGSVTRTIADVYGNVKVVTKDAVMTANEGHYDMTTRKIKAKGNVHVDYVTAKSIGTSLNDAMNSKKGAK